MKTRIDVNRLFEISVAFILVVWQAPLFPCDEHVRDQYDSCERALDRGFEALLGRDYGEADKFLKEVKTRLDLSGNDKAAATQLAEADMLLAVIAYEKHGALSIEAMSLFAKASSTFANNWTIEPDDESPSLKDLLVLKCTLDRLQRAPKERLSALPRTVLAYLSQAAGDAGILFMNRQYQEAKDCFETALLLNRIATGNRPDANTVALLSNLAVLMNRAGFLHEALDRQRESLLFSEQCDIDGLERAKGHNNLARIYGALEDFDLADHEFRVALSLLDPIPVNTNRDVIDVRIAILGNMAVSHSDRGRYSEAIAAEEEIIKILESDGKAEQRLSLAYHNYGGFLGDAGRFEEGILSLEKSLELKSRLFPTVRFPHGHSSLAVSLHLVAELYLRHGRLTESETSVGKALDMRRKLAEIDPSPANDLHLSDSLTLWAEIQIRRGNHAEAWAALTKAMELARVHIDFFISQATVADSLAYAKRLREIRNHAFALHDAQAVSAHDLYQVVWESKSSVFQILRRRNLLWSKLENDHVNELRRELLDVTQEVSGVRPSGSTANNEIERLKHLRGEQRRLTTVLARQLGRPVSGVSRVSSDLVKVLPDNLGFVEIVQVEGKPTDKSESNSQYVAFVLRRNVVTPRIVVLGDSRGIDELIGKFHSAIVSRQSNFYESGKQLLETVWLPISEAMSGQILPQHVVIAADGLMSTLPWDALPSATGVGHLAEDYIFSVAIHGEHFAEDLFAGAKMSGDVPLRATLVGDLEYPCIGDGANYAPLPATEAECDVIRQRIEACHGIVVADLRRRSADPRSVLAAISHSSVAHLATHLVSDRSGSYGSKIPGEFLPQSLERCGVVLTSPDEMNSCILRGSEISSATLSDTWLVVLAGCLGGSEEESLGESGLSALDHSLQLAGVDVTIASGWEVNDTITLYFMDVFYRELFASGSADPTRALHQAKLAVLRNGPASDAQHPYYWAGWRLSGSPVKRRFGDCKQSPEDMYPEISSANPRDMLKLRSMNPRRWLLVTTLGCAAIFLLVALLPAKANP